MMIAQPLTFDERKQWTGYFQSHLAERLHWVTAYVSGHQQKLSYLQPYGDSLLALIRQACLQPQLSQATVDLILALHPLPERWGYWDRWEEVLQSGARLAANSWQTAELLAHQAYLLWSCSRWSKAVVVGRAALRKAEQLQTVLPMGIGGSALVNSLNALGRQEEAEQLLHHLLDNTAELRPLNSESHSITALISLKHSQALLYRLQGKQAQAMAVARQMLHLAKEQPNISPFRLGDTYVEQATMLWAGGDYEAAVKALQEAIHLFERVGDRVAAIFASGNLGLVYWSMAQYDLAEQRMKQCVAFCEQSNVRWRLISEVGNLAVLYLGQGRLQQALHYAENHFDMAQQYGHNLEASRARLNRGAILTYLQAYDTALKDLEMSLAQVRAEGRQELVAAVQIDLSLCYAGLNQPQKAEQYAHNAYEMAEQMAFPGLTIIALRTLARYSQQEERITRLQTALGLAEKHQRRLDEAGCLFSLVGLTADQSKQTAYWQRAVHLLAEIGAAAWLDNHSRQNPPFVALML